jgi:MFS family permease
MRAKSLVLLGLVIGIMGMVLLTLSPWVWLCVIGMFMAMGGCIISYNLTYIFITELVEEKKRQTHKVIISAIFSVGALLNVLWFYVLPNFEIVLLAFYGLPLLIVGILFLLFFKDTPASLITKYTA